MTEPKICADCRHINATFVCHHPKSVNTDLVTGYIAKLDCYTARSSDGPCGPEGRLWEPKAPEAAPVVESAS